MVHIRKYKAGDEKQILSLFNSVFKHNRHEDYWRWQFFKNPIKKPIIVLGEDDGDIIGQCTLLPTKIIAENKGIFAGQSIDTMVHKDYRGRGLHKELAERTYEIGMEDDIKFRIGFPSQDALRGLLGSIGGTLVTDIPIYMNIYKLDNFIRAIVKIKPLAKILSIPGIMLIRFLHREKKIKIENNYEIKEIEEFNDDFDKFWDKIKENSPLMSIRSSEFLNWRIKEHPTIQYKTLAAYLDGEIKGYMILKTEERILRGKVKSKLGSIVDVVGESEDVIACLYYEAKKYFKIEKVDFVVSWATDSMKYKDLLIQLGFQKSKSKIPFVVKDLSKDKELEELINKEENWYLMPIESDFY